MKNLACMTASAAASLAVTQFAAAGAMPGPVYLQNATFTVDVGGQSSSGSWNNTDGYQVYSYFHSQPGAELLKGTVGFSSFDPGDGSYDILSFGGYKKFNAPNQLITFTLSFSLSTACEIINQPIAAGATDRSATLNGASVGASTIGTILAAGSHTIVYQADVSGYGANGYWTGLVAGFNFKPAAVPAPGAIALLGLAGLAGRRRR